MGQFTKKLLGLDTSGSAATESHKAIELAKKLGILIEQKEGTVSIDLPSLEYKEIKLLEDKTGG